MFTLITDSCADLNPEFVEAQRDFAVLPLTYKIGEENYPDLPGMGLDAKTFYSRLRGGEMAVTSQLNAHEVSQVILPLIKEGKEVLFLAFSSGLSGTYQSVVLAKEMVVEQYPEANIRVVDTLCASAGQGLLVYHALQLRKAGKTVDEVADWAEANKLKMAHWFTVDDLNFLKRGGRCSAAAAFLGTMLMLKPVLHVNNEGKLIAREKVRGRKGAIKALADHMASLAVNPKDQMIHISHADCMEDAQSLKSQISERFGTPADNIFIMNVGPVIGSHAGPGTLALFFLATDRG